MGCSQVTNETANSSAQYLGLTNASTDGNSTNHIVDVEFDTYKQEFDPDDNHVGIDVQGLVSVATVSLASHNITLATVEPRYYNVWVDHDGGAKFIQAYIAQQMDKTAPTPPKSVSPVLSYGLNLMEHVKQDSYFGFAASTGNNREQLKCVLRWNLTVDYFPVNKNWLPVALGEGIPSVVVLVVGAVGVGYCYHKRLMAVSNPKNLEGALRSLPGTPREFKFKDLKLATNNFDEKSKLGEGGYGEVFRGLLMKEKLEIAVKRFSRESIKGQDDFLAELTIINRLRHRHLVKLLGWCHKYGKLLLVYEYMLNSSLDKHLFVGPDAETLGWHERYNIIFGVASALQYLHNEYDQRVVHRDLKPSNIMLDSHFNARLGDFGLARALDDGRTSYVEAEGVLGTMGYIATECFLTRKAKHTQQSDVYAFRAVMLEVVCGKRPGAKIAGFDLLVDWVWYMHRDGRLLERPKTQDIVQIISSTVPAPVVPPFKPAFVWPAAVEPMILDSDSTKETTTMTTLHFGSGWSGQCLSRESYTCYTDSSV